MKPFAKRMLALVSAAAIILSAIPVVCGAESGDSPAMARSVSCAAPLTHDGLGDMITAAYSSYNTAAVARMSEPAALFPENTDAAETFQLSSARERTDVLFTPDTAVSRQDFFIAAVRLLEALGYTYAGDIFVDLSVYEDAGDLTDYAVQPARVLLYIGALDAEAPLEPQRLITVEEAQTILDRTTAFFDQWQADPVAPERYLGLDVAEFALEYVGCRYVRGGHGPNKFDCSGFVYYVYKNFGYDLKPGARNQWSLLDRQIEKNELLPGDLVFFSSNGRASRIFHVGIYIGDGEFVHAANSRKGLIVTGLDEPWYANRYLGAKRVIG